MATPEEIRARGIRRDIFARHGIPEGTSDAQAAAMIEEHAQQAGAGPSAWANPEERANARAEYAARGGNPDEVQKRWEDSIYLVDPATHNYNQNFRRDREFLENIALSGEREPSVEAWTGATGAPTQARVQNAVAAWDQTNNNPLYRDSWSSSGWSDQSGIASTVMNAISNPDLPLGKFMNPGNAVYDFLALQGSGEGNSAVDSGRAAAGNYMTAANNRLDTPAPILDLPSSASPRDRAQRLKELQQESATAAVPDSGERWERTTGIVPPPLMRDTGDAFLAAMDGTQLIPGMPVMKGAVGAAKGVAKSAAKRALVDTAQDAAVSVGLAGAFAQDPSRTWAQYVGLAPEAEGAVTMKTPEQVREAEEARSQKFQRSLLAPGVSTADSDAYRRLQESGKAPYRSR